MSAINNTHFLISVLFLNVFLIAADNSLHYLTRLSQDFELLSSYLPVMPDKDPSIVVVYTQDPISHRYQSIHIPESVFNKITNFSGVTRAKSGAEELDAISFMHLKAIAPYIQHDEPYDLVNVNPDQLLSILEGAAFYDVNKLADIAIAAIVDEKSQQYYLDQLKKGQSYNFKISSEFKQKLIEAFNVYCAMPTKTMPMQGLPLFWDANKDIIITYRVEDKTLNIYNTITGSLVRTLTKLNSNYPQTFFQYDNQHVIFIDSGYRSYAFYDTSQKSQAHLLKNLQEVINSKNSDGQIYREFFISPNKETLCIAQYGIKYEKSIIIDLKTKKEIAQPEISRITNTPINWLEIIWSPNSRYILYIVDKLRIYDVEKHKFLDLKSLDEDVIETRITDETFIVSTWNNKSDTIAIKSIDKYLSSIYLINIEKDTAEEIKDKASVFSFNPTDTFFISFDRNYRNYFDRNYPASTTSNIFNLVGKLLRTLQITMPLAGQIISGLIWRPDGKQIALYTSASAIIYTIGFANALSFDQLVLLNYICSHEKMNIPELKYNEFIKKLYATLPEDIRKQLESPSI